MNSCGSHDSSLFIGSAVNIEGLQGWNWSGWKEEVLDERRVDEVSGSSTIYKGCGGNGSRFVL